MRTHTIPLASLLLALPAAASSVASPVEALHPATPQQQLQQGELELALRPEIVSDLLGQSHVELAAFPLSDGSRVDLALDRLDLAQLELGIQVDGRPAPGLLDGLQLSVWSGKVAGRDDSQAMLSFSQVGAQGWVLLDGTLHHLISRGAGEVWMVSEERLLELGGQRGVPCAFDALERNHVEPRPVPPPASGKAGGKSGSPSLYRCTVALETDYQLNQVFGGDLQAETAYVTTLITWASYRYEEQIGTVLTYPYLQFYTTSNDPWHAQDTGGSCIDVLYELQAAWAGQVPMNCDIGHLMSGANLGCGVAWLPGLCNSPYNFSVSGNINGAVSFPIQVSPANWDFMVMTHEVGHNFNALHTHDYCPPLDECAPPGYFGQCQSQQVCTNEGTLMSYCHLCPGGTANITTYFHPVSVTDMRNWVESTCLPLYAPDPVTYCTPKVNSQGCVPLIGWEGHPTLSGLDDFAVTATFVLNNKSGMLLHSPASASLPFNGGTLCLGAPISRTVLQSSGGTPPPTADCSGTLYYPWTHALLAPLGAGTTVYAQYWYRDSASTGAVGLTDGLSFVIAN